MKRGSTLFLKLVIILLGIVVFAWMIIFPQTEGRAKDLDLFHIYNDPFIIYCYIASIPFFVGLYQAFKLLNFIDTGKAFSQDAVNTLKIIKYASLILVGFIVLAVFYIRFLVHGEDSAGPTAFGFILSFVGIVTAVGAGVFQKLLQNAVDLKFENDLTV